MLGFTLMVSVLRNGKNEQEKYGLNQQHMNVFYGKPISERDIKGKIKFY